MEEVLVRETLRYMGCGGAGTDPGLRRLAEECLAELIPRLTLREIHRVFPLERDSEDVLRIEGMEIHSRALGRNLRGCREVCLMAATIGDAPDRMAARCGAQGKVGHAAAVQAAGAALIENWCDRVNETVRAEAAASGGHTRPRFSPGYGDFALEHQRELFQILQITKYTGITLTESLLMQPTKSVTALIGIGAEKTDCPPAGCEACGKADCAYRRNYGAC